MSRDDAPNFRCPDSCLSCKFYAFEDGYDSCTKWPFQFADGEPSERICDSWEDAK